MGFISEDAKWYLAQILVKIAVEDDPRSVLHTNWILVRADSPEEAYQRALELGRQEETGGYKNRADKWVHFAFCGLRDLNVIHEELEHGAELTYDEDVGLSDEQIRKRVSSKEALGVFRPIERPTNRLDYSSKEIMDEAVKLLEAARKVAEEAGEEE